MATRTISTRITLDGEQEFKKQMSSVNSELRNLKSEMGLVEAEFKGQANSVEALTEKDQLLRREVAQQQEKVRALEQALRDASDAYGDTDKRTDSYRQSLNKAKTELIKMNDELEDTDKYLKEAERAADGCATSIDGFGKSTESGGGFLAEYGDKLRMLGVAGVAGAAVNGLKEVANAVLEIEESTREYRQIMGTLEVSAQAAGYTAEETTQAYERLYGVLGDTQTAATTVANLQAIGLSQKDLILLSDAATGAWAKYGDSIPIDGLAEAINETIRIGQVTGTFADLLNWGAQEGETYGVMLKDNIEFTKLSNAELAKLTETELAEYEAKKASYDATEKWNQAVNDAAAAEDYFNLALQNCETEAERADLILQAMANQGLSDLGQGWRDVNEDIVAANESQAKMDEAMGQLGESLAPIANAIRSFGADAIIWLADRITDAINAAKSLIDWLNAIPDDPGVDARGEGRGWNVDGSHAGGLEYVPYDGYIAELHKGERVLTQSEANAFRTLSMPTTRNESAASREIQQLTKLVAAVASDGAGTQKELVVNINWSMDGETIARKQYRYNHREATLRGGALVEVSG